jgi:excisionase family DNA binding protein
METKVKINFTKMKPLTIAEACAFLKMEKSTLHKLMKARAFPFYHRPASRVVLFDQDDLEKWLQSGRVPAANEAYDPQQEAPRTGIHAAMPLLDIVPENVYHRNPCYR